MKLFVGGFYCEPLKWQVQAETMDEAAKRFAEVIKRDGLKSESGTKVIVVFEAKEEPL